MPLGASLGHREQCLGASYLTGRLSPSAADVNKILSFLRRHWAQKVFCRRVIGSPLPNLTMETAAYTSRHYMARSTTTDPLAICVRERASRGVSISVFSPASRYILQRAFLPTRWDKMSHSTYDAGLMTVGRLE